MGNQVLILDVVEGDKKLLKEMEEVEVGEAFVIVQSVCDLAEQTQLKQFFSKAQSSLQTCLANYNSQVAASKSLKITSATSLYFTQAASLLSFHAITQFARSQDQLFLTTDSN